MNWTPWSVVRFGLGDGVYGLMRSESPPPPRGRMATLDYHMANGRKWTTASLPDAERERDRLNGRLAIPRRCTDAEFEAVTGHVRMSVPIRGALRSILVDGTTWQAAARRFGVTESGILRAMRRVEERNLETA